MMCSVWFKKAQFKSHQTIQAPSSWLHCLPACLLANCNPDVMRVISLRLALSGWGWTAGGWFTAGSHSISISKWLISLDVDCLGTWCSCIHPNFYSISFQIQLYLYCNQWSPHDNTQVMSTGQIDRSWLKCHIKWGKYLKPTKYSTYLFILIIFGH